MKTVVIYKSKTGFTKKYANWIAECLSADIIDAKKGNIDLLATYDTIIYGGGLYASGINGVKLITQNFDKIKTKKIIVFATGASPAREEVDKDVKEKNFTQAQLEKIKFYYLRGGFDYSKLNVFDKFLMSLLKWMINRKKREGLTQDEIGMMAIYNKPTDYTREAYIEDLITYATS